jgi:hypothetical protein
MTTARLLRGMTWRGALWSAKSGILCFLALAIVNFVLFVVHPCYLRETCGADAFRDENGGLGFLKALLSPIFLVIIGLVFGVLGSINGFLQQIMRRGFVSQEKNFQYRPRLLAIVIGFTALVEAIITLPFSAEIWLVFDFRLTKILDEFLPQVDSRLIEKVMWIILFILCEAYVSRLLAHWYERESAKGNAQNVGPN